MLSARPRLAPDLAGASAAQSEGPGATAGIDRTLAIEAAAGSGEPRCPMCATSKRQAQRNAGQNTVEGTVCTPKPTKYQVQLSTKCNPTSRNVANLPNTKAPTH